MMRDGSVYPGEGPRVGRSERHRRAPHRREESARREARQLERSRDRRMGDRHRQSVRVLPRQQRAERERRRDQRDAAQPHRAGRGSGVVLRHDPDRRGDQSRQLRRAARQRRRRSDRREQQHLLAERRLGRAWVRDSDQSRRARGGRSDHARLDPQPVDRRAAPAVELGEPARRDHAGRRSSRRVDAGLARGESRAPAGRRSSCAKASRVIHNPFDWQAALLDLRVGQPAHLHVKRGTREFDVDVEGRRSARGHRAEGAGAARSSSS